MATLSGTIGCPSCRPGTFQPGFLGDDECDCVGMYHILARVRCTRVNAVYNCNTTVTITGTEPAVCHCDGQQPYEICEC